MSSDTKTKKIVLVTPKLTQGEKDLYTKQELTPEQEKQEAIQVLQSGIAEHEKAKSEDPDNMETYDAAISDMKKELEKLQV